jgi:hypothetical protein
MFCPQHIAADLQDRCRVLCRTQSKRARVREWRRDFHILQFLSDEFSANADLREIPTKAGKEARV